MAEGKEEEEEVDNEPTRIGDGDPSSDSSSDDDTKDKPKDDSNDSESAWDGAHTSDDTDSSDSEVAPKR